MPLALVCIHPSRFKLRVIFLQQFNKGGIMHETAVNIYKPVLAYYHLAKCILKTKAS